MQAFLSSVNLELRRLYNRRNFLAPRVGAPSCLPNVAPSWQRRARARNNRLAA